MTTPFRYRKHPIYVNDFRPIDLTGIADPEDIKSFINIH